MFSAATSDPDIVQIIVFVLIGVVYAVGTVLKKVNQWLNARRERIARENEAGAADWNPNSAPSDPVSPPPAPVPPASPATDPAQVLLKELQKALLGIPSEEAPAPPPPPPPVVVPTGFPAVPFRSRRSEAAAQEFRPRSQAVSGPVAPASSAPRLSTPAAHVRRNTLAHLRVLLTPSDLQRAWIAGEILAPPLALRRSGNGPRSWA